MNRDALVKTPFGYTKYRRPLRDPSALTIIIKIIIIDNHHNHHNQVCVANPPSALTSAGCAPVFPPGCNCDPEVTINLLCCWLLVLIDFAPSTTITINNYRPLLKTQRAPPQKLVSSVVASNRSSLLNLSWSSNSGFTKRVTFIFTQVGSLFPNLDF